MKHPAATVTVALLCLTLALPVSASQQQSSPELTVQDGALRDSAGRQIFLWGMNVGEKSASRQHRGWYGRQDFQNLRRWGMNAIRLLIFWSAIEPEPGRYDEDYLASVDETVALARDAGLYVILDMHQDLWGASIPGGNGAPPWATLDDGLPHFTAGSVWSTAYYVSPRVHRVFDHFWNNTPGPGGIGIQERFARMWRHVASHYKNTPHVIGFDLMNEPFPGSSIQDTMPALWEVFPKILQDVSTPASWQAWMNSITEKPLPPWLLEALDDPVRHRQVLKAIQPVMERFEQERLMPMYRRVHAAIREVHPSAILFLEPCVLANIGVPTAIEALCNAAGERDPLQAYLPHAYDIVTDTSLSPQPSENRLNMIVEQKHHDAERLGMPILIGEWGAYYGAPETRDAARMMHRLLAQHTSGAFYWDYHRNIEQAPYFEILARPAPLALAGALDSWTFSPESATFQCVWQNNPGPAAESRFALPAFWPAETMAMRVEPAELIARIETDPHNSAVRTVTVTNPGASGRATLTLALPQSTLP
ncbi:MAG: Cellulase (glycosyl hydrolase family 5) [Candidatus Hydrogenedentes bacterium ADurb.Bin179]|nr:MAG: Cellulase (glycosyl hydrolase family 5) [Candidatus Hydrogenedentes bacterium ADurb.Bin179]